ncbi:MULTISPECIES: amidohydrolase family protein [Bradyrhizobium]|jgi:2-pyrone-4,6-dicarboxylate lactonase|uniref:Predicted metal-dependent hydrolase, TIM-barrel fold n=2 Tax=Bradyrhizobium TaxID=374 RepID=A0ABY0PTK3_9BRAD|nr:MULTISPECIES: amidohydrolase family protein [Bradyrhizobium]SDI92520.1 Predicted metal-dependent hydrolase, TIM-barrel fold [Bradyrhizobium ottawaense]SED08082.1 Predicted metal-dependent hydrolase, TIM-barrel fold [Bradyrhizobium lablabi]SHL14410.1 Predicted metal-dependent hydrolase, TIM-barrel fold [Bradyrhizobium lablabi]
MASELRFPDGSCDCHVHIYGPYDRFPAQSEGRFSPTQANPVESLFAMWDSIGVSRGVIVHALAAGEDNEVTLDALRRYPERLRAVAILKRDVSDRRLDEMTDAGFKGVRINLLRQDGKPVSSGGMNLDDLKALAPRLAERKWHAQLWIETGDLDALAPELEKLPLDFVIDHMGRTMVDKGIDYPGFQKFCERLKTGRYWVKLSGADRNTRAGAPYADTAVFMTALAQANPDRLVWGTDWPHVGHTPESFPKEADLIDLFSKCAPDEAARRKILVDNPVRLYGF